MLRSAKVVCSRRAARWGHPARVRRNGFDSRCGRQSGPVELRSAECGLLLKLAEQLHFGTSSAFGG
jgi:hypothetical protein